MGEKTDILAAVRAAGIEKRLFLPHALQQMSRPDRMISTADVRLVINTGEVIEDYPEDPRGHSCVILGQGEAGRPIHVVCSPKDDYLAIIAAYSPDPKQWSADFRVRVKK